MRKFSISVRHYWAKTTDIKYGGPFQQLAIELGITLLMLSLTIYFANAKGLEIFFAGFVVPTVVFALGSCITAYHLLSDYLARRNSDEAGKDNRNL